VALTRGSDVPPPIGADAGDLPVAEFEREGRVVLEWIAAYLAHPERYPVLSQVVPGQVRDALPTTAPENGEPLDRILREFEETIVPGITHWNHPAFFGYFATSSSVPGILAEMLIAALDVKAMLWRTSPAATELEEVVMDWLRQMLGLGPGWFGLITDTASMSSMLALAAAREAKPELEIRERGMAGRSDVPRLRVYASSERHSSIDKAALALGLGLENVVKVEVDEHFRMRADALAHAVAADRRLGFLPLAVVATVGTTNTSSIDPVPEIAALCEREQMWLHVDAAYGGIAAIVPEFRPIFAGVDRADSLVVNPHKWLFTPFDCSAFFVRRPEVLKRAFSIVPEYLATRGQDGVVNFMDYGVQLGRRFRSLKLWMVIRAFGVEGLVARLRHHRALALRFSEAVAADVRWELLAPVPFALVCFRYAPPGTDEATRDALNAALLDRVNATGDVFLSHTKLRGRFAIRLAIGNIRTEERHVALAWERLRQAAEAVAPAG